MVVERAVHIACKTLMGAASSFPLSDKLLALDVLHEHMVPGRFTYRDTFMLPATINQDMKCDAYDKIIKWNAARLTKE